MGSTTIFMIVAAVFIILLLIGMPIAFALGITSTIWLMVTGQNLMMIGAKMYSGLDSFVFMAIPLFVLAGEIMNKTSITDSLVKFINVLIGGFRGALAQANIYTSLLFAGLTGAAISDVSAIGSIYIPAMSKQGYKPAFAAAITATSSIVGPIIPPSIIMVMYGGITGVSIGALFAGAIIPGILIGIGQSIYLFAVAKKKNFPKSKIKVTPKEFMISFRNALVAIVMPFIILGGLIFGIFTPTEAAAVAVAYAMAVGFIIFRTLKVSDLYGLLSKTVRISGMLFFIIATANILGWVISRVNLPERLTISLMSVSGQNAGIALFIIVIFLLFIGTWMECGAATVVIAPIIAPIAVKLGFHPVHFGITMCVALNIGLVTPPLGVCLFAAAGISGCSFEQIVKEAWPIIILMIVSLFLIAFVPELTLLIPRKLGLIM